MNLSEPFIRRPVATTLVMAALAFVGITAYPFLPVAPLPQVDFPTIQVTATFQGASAETMASSVAAPLERQFAQIPGVTQLTSLSALGASTIVIQFDLNRNIDSAGFRHYRHGGRAMGPPLDHDRHVACGIGPGPRADHGSALSILPTRRFSRWPDQGSGGYPRHTEHEARAWEHPPWICL